MSRQRTLIRNVLKLYQKAGLSLLAMGMSASVLANQLPQGPQINQKTSARLVLNARDDATQAAHAAMAVQLSPHRPAGNGVKSVPTASDQIDRFKTSGNPSKTQAQLKLLQELGCDLGQGFYFQKASTGEMISQCYERGLPLGRAQTL